ncbi:type IV secretion protein DotG (plasmid) [Aeromonas veronii]|nr:type IV secretion protein DotG [Aeromonas veronii]
MKRNFNAVFGHGVGKISLIVVAVVVIGGVALGYRGLTSKPTEVAAQSEVDVPNAPQPGVEVGAVSKQEAERRAQRAALRLRRPPLAARPTSRASTRTSSTTPASRCRPARHGTVQRADPDRQQQPAVTAGWRCCAGQHHRADRAGHCQSGRLRRRALSIKAKARTPSRTLCRAAGTAASGAGVEAGAGRARQVCRCDERASAETSAVAVWRGRAGRPECARIVLDRQLLPGEPQQRRRSGWCRSRYCHRPLAGDDAHSPDTLGDPSAKLLIKTGNMMYATLDSEVNTDDGGDVLATIRGGKWDGAKIIGRVEQGPNNIRLKFSTMAPQDGRPTMRINAVALREEDAKQGVADDIDHHTFERYTSLAVASLLSGYGRAYSTPVGTTVISPGGTVSTTTTEPTNKQVIGMAVGEMGQAMAQEIRRGFNRPTTYSTPAQKGFGLFFMQDVHEQK